MSETTQFLIRHGLPLVFAAVLVEQMGLPIPALPVLAIAKFVPGMSTVAPPLAGMSGVHFARFLFADGLGSIFYGITFLGLGYLFSRQIEQIGAAISDIGGNALGLLVLLVGSYIAYKFWQRRRLLRELRTARITVAELR